VDGNPQVAAVGEVAGPDPAGVVGLGEEHLFRRPVRRPPRLHPPLEGAELAVGVPAGVPPLEVPEHRLGLQPGVGTEQVLDRRPDVGERVGAGPPVAIHASDLTGQPAEAAVRAGSLRVQAGPGGGLVLGQPEAVEPPESEHLLVGDHRGLCVEGSPRVSARWRPGIAIVVGRGVGQKGSGILIVAGREL
jgi:hypothetical protein